MPPCSLQGCIFLASVIVLPALAPRCSTDAFPYHQSAAVIAGVVLISALAAGRANTVPTSKDDLNGAGTDTGFEVLCFVECRDISKAYRRKGKGPGAGKSIA